MKRYFIIEKDNNIIDKINNIALEYADFKHVGGGFDCDVVTNMILKEKPNLVFINVDDFVDTPFNFINELSLYLNYAPKFIALSSRKTHAFQALKFNFVDYLLTPIAEVDIRKSLLKFLKANPKSFPETTLCLQSYKDYRYLNTNDILFLKADNNTTAFHLKDGSTVHAYKTLKVFEQKLPDTFLRIHKSYVINSKYVTRINYGKSNFTLNNCKFHKIPFTKTYQNNVETIVNCLSKLSIA